MLAENIEKITSFLKEPPLSLLKKNPARINALNEARICKTILVTWKFLGSSLP
jgi:hypothetical protein